MCLRGKRATRSKRQEAGGATEVYITQQTYLLPRVFKSDGFSVLLWPLLSVAASPWRLGWTWFLFYALYGLLGRCLLWLGLNTKQWYQFCMLRSTSVFRFSS